MSSQRVRAVVLTAGLGTRLRPLTDFTPKALLPVAGRPLVAHTLSQLAAAGCEAAALNLHHLGEKIQERLGGAFDGMPLTYSRESEILGTLGALAPLRGYLAEADLTLVINGDSLCHWPLRQLFRAHARSSAAATLLLATGPDAGDFGGGAGVDLEGHVVSLRPGKSFGNVERRRVFAGAHLFSPDLVSGLEERPAGFVEDLYEPLLEQGARIHAVESSRTWHDLGTPRRYLRAVLDWIRGRGAGRLLRQSWIAPGAEVDEAATVRRSAVENGARVAAGAVIEGSLLLPGAQIGSGCRVRGSIIGFDATLPPETAVERRLVTRTQANVSPGKGDSAVGGLTYSVMAPATARA